MLRIGLVLLVVPGVLMMAVFMYEQSLVDSCLDAGGSFDYLNSYCDHETTQPFISMMGRHPLLVNGGMLLSVVGLIICMLKLYVRAPKGK